MSTVVVNEETLFKDWQKSRFEAAMFNVLHEVCELGDLGQNTEVCNSIIEGMSAYIDINGCQPLDPNNESPNNVVRWLFSTHRSLNSIFYNLSIMNTLIKYVDENKGLQSYIEGCKNSKENEVMLLSRKMEECTNKNKQIL
ncbi:MAG: hypothetical protein PHI48_06315 [Bacteroidales bacterium]|nr:hypothetical protein [Bacteroidales bacterium]